ncbi:LOW QUALITY PROTEIN: carboxylesterase 5A-like [Cloeon dipterum]|uniref:LOW QUALITY PROTEIN: carboxylesterase 5A-like n=1 Tax=Cloeon dipterum TaxID=197152 RepID=UPI00322015FE
MALQASPLKQKWRERVPRDEGSSSTVAMLVPSLVLVLLGAGLGARPREPPVVTVPGQGPVGGVEVAISRSQKGSLYLAIPFAQPPLEEFRFAPPMTDPLPTWTEKRAPTGPAPACPQAGDVDYEKLATSLFGAPIADQSEDCLYLNVLVPDGNPPGDGWPVMLWFHPGMFQAGFATQWDASAMAIKHKMIVVTAAYRLNILGFLSTLDANCPGNLGLHDQVAALDWVNGKISAFGGSANNITIMGYGSGGVSVGLHLVSPLSEGRFHKAIAMSGNALVPWAVRKYEVEKMKLATIADAYGCPKNTATNSAKLLECLRKVDAMTLAKMAPEIGMWGPVIDGPFANVSFLPHDPLDMLREGKAKTMVPLLLGYTNMEEAMVFATMNMDKGLDRGQFEATMLEHISSELNDANMTCTNEQSILDAVLFYYSPQPTPDDSMALRERLMGYAVDKKYAAGAFLQAVHNSKHSPTYMYRFDYKMKTNLVDAVPEWAAVPHLFDLPFVWGMPYWPPAATQQKIVWNSADKKITDVIMMLWANFVRTANPVHAGVVVKWEAFVEDSPAILLVDTKFNLSDTHNFDYRSFSFWNDYYPKVMEHAAACCNISSAALPIGHSWTPFGHVHHRLWTLAPLSAGLFAARILPT